MRVQPRPIDKAALRSWLSDHQWTQAELARVLDVSDKTVERWAQGVTPPPSYLSYVLDQLDALAAKG